MFSWFNSKNKLNAKQFSSITQFQIKETNSRGYIEDDTQPNLIYFQEVYDLDPNTWDMTLQRRTETSYEDSIRVTNSYFKEKLQFMTHSSELSVTK